VRNGTTLEVLTRRRGLLRRRGLGRRLLGALGAAAETTASVAAAAFTAAPAAAVTVVIVLGHGCAARQKGQGNSGRDHVFHCRLRSAPQLVLDRQCAVGRVNPA
jgi:hypothetical protein